MAQTNPSMLLVGIAADVEARLVAGVKSFNVARAAAELRAVSDAIANHRPAAAVVSMMDKDADLSLHLVTQLVRGGARVMVVGATKDAELILKAMRAGAQEFVVPGEEPRLAEAIEGKLAHDSVHGPGAVVTLFPARGGIGATAVAANLANALGRRRDRVCLLDLDLNFGGAVSLLDLQGSYAIADLMENMQRLDRELLDGTIARHASGFAVVGPSEKIEDAERVKPRDVGALVRFLREHYRYVVIDGVRGFDELSLAALDASDRIVVIVTQDVTAIRNAQRSIELFRKLGYEDSKIAVVINRYHRNAKLTVPLVAETLGFNVAATLSNDFAALIESINRGVLLAQSAPRSALTRDIVELAELVRGEDAPGEQSRSFFARLFGR